MSNEKVIVRIEEPMLTPEQEQMKWLGEATRNVKERAAEMNKAIADKQFVMVLKAASQMLSELRTGMLNPSYYYELYVTVFDQLHALETYFLDEYERGRKVSDMYEVVQHAGNIIPRLYLLITVGCVFVKTKEAPVREIIQDLVEMCKGVQHPTRGLFIRHHLLSMLKSKLPDKDNEYEGEGGSVEDSIGFIVQNFKEMVWLWVRMDRDSMKQHGRSRKEKERKELRILVGYNIVRLSQLEGITKSGYKESILPRILTIIMTYKEPLAQQYLLEVVIQVFPDEFHLSTLKILLEWLSGVTKGVDLHAVLSALMDRLGKYVEGQREGVTEGSNSKKEGRIIAEMFDIFGAEIATLAANETLFTGATFTETQLSLMKLAIKAYPGEYARVDAVLANIYARFSKNLPDAEATKALRKCLQYLMDELKDPNVILDLANFDTVVQLMPFKARRDIGIGLSTTAVNSDQKVTSMERVVKLFEIISPLVHNVEDTPSENSEIYADADEFAEEQALVARVLHTIDADDLPTLMKMYNGVRKKLGQGGIDRMRITLKAMASLYMRAALRINKAVAAGEDVGVDITKPFSYLHDPDGKGKGILDILVADIPVECFPIYLACANTADVCGCSDISYDLYVQAFEIYNENAADPHEQCSMLSSIMSSLIATRSLTEESYGVLTSKVTQYSSKFLQKHDQAHAAALCSNMFVRDDYSEEITNNVAGCMRRAIKCGGASTAMHQPVAFVEILNQYLHLFAAERCEVKEVNTAIELIRDANANAGDEGKNNAEVERSKLFYRNTTKYIRSRASEEESWKEIDL